MITDNSAQIKRIKRVFYPGAILMALVTFALILTGRDLLALVCGLALVGWFVVFQLADIQFIQFGVEAGRVVLRHYPAVKFGRKDYKSIEFPVNILHDFIIEKSFSGLVRDLILVVRTKQGIAEYPPVSLTGVSREEQLKIERRLRDLLRR